METDNTQHESSPDSGKKSSEKVACSSCFSHRNVFTFGAIVLVLFCHISAVYSRSVDSVYHVPASAKPGYVISISPQQNGQISHFEHDDNSGDISKDLFRIGNPGQLVINKDLVPYTGKLFSLVVEHKSDNDRSWSENINIKVVDSVTSTQFVNQPYFGNVAENKAALSEVEGLESLYRDIEKFPYGCWFHLVGPSAPLFKLSGWPFNPSILTKIDFDRERQPFLSVTIQADCNGAVVQASLVVRVEDENDNPPAFESPFYTKQIPLGGISPDVTLAQIQAKDSDYLDTITYMLDDDQTFYVESKTGEIKVKADAVIRPKSYELKAFAVDQGGHRSQAALIRIEITAETSSPVVSRSKRQTGRTLKTVVVRRFDTGDLFTATAIPAHPQERYDFLEPRPVGLQIERSDGVVRLIPGYVWNSTLKVMDFAVNVTRENDPFYEEVQQVMMHLIDRGWEESVFTNQPGRMVATIPEWIRPDTIIHRVQAKDAQSPYFAPVLYKLESVSGDGEGCFAVDELSGDVAISCRRQFPLDTDYSLAISARCQDCVQSTFTPVQILTVHVGALPPQFYHEPYVVDMPETTSAQSTVVRIQAVSFQDVSLRYSFGEMDGAASGVFSINSNTGAVILQKSLRHVFDPHRYRMQIIVKEDYTDLTTISVLTVNLIGVNLNQPFFPAEVYVVSNVEENRAINALITEIEAVDIDQGDNGMMQFSVSDDHFSVDGNGDGKTAVIRVKSRLDYDFTEKHRYEFILTAVDRGNPSLTGSTTVQVWMTNQNDESPIMDPPEQVVRVKEDATANVLIHIVQAYDPDGQQLAFTFSGGSDTFDLFRIDRNTGRITLTRTISPGTSDFDLVINVSDGTSTTTGIVSVKFIGVNHPPRFPDCNNYPGSAKLLESQPVNTSIIDMTVVDDDSGENGILTFRVVINAAVEESLFKIGEVTTQGLTSTVELISNMTLDREDPARGSFYANGKQSYKVTVLAEDNGSPKLAASCFFFVEIEDINDNIPRFDQTTYETIIMRNTNAGAHVIRIFAVDDDAGSYGTVRYSIKRQDPSCPNCFQIDENKGWITKSTAAPLNMEGPLQLIVVARDGEDQVSADGPVNIFLTDDSSELPPVFNTYNSEALDDAVFTRRENATDYSQFLTLTTNKDAIFAIIEGRTAMENRDRNFVLADETDTQTEITTANLNYLVVPEYSVRVRASPLDAGNQFYTDVRLRVNIEDVNNQKPFFVGTNELGAYPAAVSEQTNVGDDVVKVTAIDADGTSPNNQVIYSFGNNCDDCNAFGINEMTGAITARQRYDPDVKNQYILNVLARDRATTITGEPYYQTSIKVTIRVTGPSVNSPYFRQAAYTYNIDEGMPFNTTVATVTAFDPQNGQNEMQYQIRSGNSDRRFAVDSKTGRIYNVAELLDEDQETYVFTYGVFDGIKTNTTQVTFNLVSRNIYPPSFTQTLYEVANIQENDGTITSGNPRLLAQVSATDSDTSEPSSISYRLAGEYARPDTFEVRPNGQVILKKALDRDYPSGTADYLINVVADDNNNNPSSQLGYSMLSVKLLDQNDNPPIFDSCCLVGEVIENSQTGARVLQLEANDYDTGSNAQMVYSKVEMPTDDQDRDLFTVSPTGIVTTMVPLDRETQEDYTAVVKVYDPNNQELSATQTITMKILDENDNQPLFSPKTYQFNMPEEIAERGNVGAVFATDADSGENAQLTFSIQSGLPTTAYFYMDSIFNAQSGIIRVLQRIDYESAVTQKTFTFNVRVQDPLISNADSAQVTINVIDINDNAPVFTQPVLNITVQENENVPLPSFTATDADTGENADFEYFIDYEASEDKERRFQVDSETGKVSLRKTLDRETMSFYQVHVLAIDKGVPPLTGTATLNVVVEDVNDGGPDIDEMSPLVPTVSKSTMSGAEVLSFNAVDADGSGNGAPFVFELVCNEAKCRDFDLTQTSSGGRDRGILRAARDGYSRNDLQFDYYDLTVRLKDQGGETHDKNIRVYISGNENNHSPGTSEIKVFNYKGEMPDTEIGRPYCTDKDLGWDTGSGKYTAQGNPSYFTVNADTGMITMEQGTPHGIHSLKVELLADGQTAVCTVNITVTYLFDDAVQSAGSIRLSGLTAEQFVYRAVGGAPTDPYTKLQASLASVLVTEQYVEIFTVRDVVDEVVTDKPMVDVYYAAHGSPYYDSSRLNGLVLINKEKISSDVGADVVMAPVNPCLNAFCFGDGCSNIYEASPSPLVVLTRQNSFVGISAYTEASCTCADTDYSMDVPACGEFSCLNNGTCVKTWNGYECDCADGFDGPHCEQTKLSFSGNGWAWFDPIAACDDLKISFEFITTQTSSLLLFNGPMYEPPAGEAQDFISVSLVNGYPQMAISIGGNLVELKVDGKDTGGQIRMPGLNNGEWHTIEIYKSGLEFVLVVDHCKDAPLSENIDSSSEDRTPCEQRRISYGPDRLLKLSSPLELGGRTKPNLQYPATVRGQTAFIGCMKNLRVNGLLYDLNIGEVRESENTAEGCSNENCAACPGNSLCAGSLVNTAALCSCKPGFMGPNCDQETPLKDFINEESYIEWDLKNTFNTTLDAKNSELQLMFRTRQSDGILFSADSFSTLERIMLEIAQNKLRVRYDLGAGDGLLGLNYVNVSDGLWHTVSVRRFGTQVILQLDNGEGKYYNESQPINAHRLLALEGRQIFGAAHVTYNVWSGQADIQQPLPQTCIRDVRYKQAWFPMDPSQDSQSDAAVVEQLKNVDDNCDSAACAGVACPFGYCEDVWRQHMCICPFGQTVSGFMCVDVLDCSVERCVNGYCVMVPSEDNDQSFVWRCNCDEGYGGTYCNMTGPISEPVSTGVAGGAIAAIVISLLVLLALILFVICWLKRRKPQYLLDDPEDDIRETVRNYDEEGAGEEDTHGYDLTRLPRPVDPRGGINGPFGPNDPDSPAYRRHDEPPIAEPEPMIPNRSRPPFPMPSDYPDIGDFIDDRMKDADDDPNAPPYDSVREYEFEGGGSSAGSLSSLQSSSSGDQDFDYLNDFGPRFQKLADLYAGGDED